MRPLTTRAEDGVECIRGDKKQRQGIKDERNQNENEMIMEQNQSKQNQRDEKQIA